jgi:hypothetical protein
MTSASQHPYARRLFAELAYMIDEGFEIPFLTDDVAEAADRAFISGAAKIARRDGRFLLAWMLARYHRELVKTYERWED